MEIENNNNIPDLKLWEKTVKKHAKRIRDMMSHNVFGRSIGDNKDALIVAVFLHGVAEGRRNSELVLKRILEKEGLEMTTQ